MKGLIFTYVMCFGGAIASLFNPFVGLLVYVCFSIVKPDSMWGFAVPEGNYSRIVAIALLIGWALKGFGDWQFGQARAIFALLVGYFLWMVLGTSWSRDTTVAWTEVEAQLKIVLPFLVGITTIKSLRQVKQLAWVIVLSHGYLAYEFNLSYYQGYNRIHEEGFGGMDNNCMAIALVTCTGMAFFLALETPKWWLKGLAFVAAALMAHAILFSFSRGGMIALVVTGIVSFLLLPKRPTHYLMFAVAALLVLRLAGAEVAARFGTAFAEKEQMDYSAASRLDLWAACWDLMKKNPQGVGPNQFPQFAESYGFPRGKEAHSLWMQMGAEAGFVGLGCLVLFYLVSMVRLFPLTRERCEVPDPWVRSAARMVIAALVGFMVSAQFVSLKGLEVPFYVVLLGANVLKLYSVPSYSWDERATAASTEDQVVSVTSQDV